MQGQYELRPYQREILRKVQWEFEQGNNRVMMQLATGAGKTGIAAEWSKLHGGKALFLCHTLSVIGQLPEEMDHWGIDVVPVGQNYLDWNTGQSVILRVRREKSFIIRSIENAAVACTPRTAFNNISGVEDMRQFTCVIVDEAHHAADSALGEAPTLASQLVSLAAQAGIPVLGITATPWRMSRLQGFSQTWQSLVEGADWIDLRTEWLADPVLKTITDTMRITGTGDRAGYDYTESETTLANLSNPIFVDRVFQIIRKLNGIASGEDSKTLIYAVGQVHALKVALSSLNEPNIRAGLLVSSSEIREQAASYGIMTNPNRVREQLLSGKLNTIINVNMVTEGYDCPDVDTICCLRPTLSLALWRQICGRGSRLTDDKKVVHIIDLTDNHERLGSPLDKYPWSLEPRGETSQVGQAWMRNCEPGYGRWSCGGQMFVGSHHCPNCEEPQGQVCERCGKFRFWNRYNAVELFHEHYADQPLECDFCVASRQYRLRI